MEERRKGHGARRKGWKKGVRDKAQGAREEKKRRIRQKNGGQVRHFATRTANKKNGKQAEETGNYMEEGRKL